MTATSIAATSGVNLGELLARTAIAFPDRPAITWRGATIDYSTFDRRARAFAGWLGRIGAAPAGRVVLYLDNCPDLLVAMFGTFYAGSTILPTNSRLTQDELRVLIDDGEAHVVVTDEAHAEIARRAASRAVVIVAGEELEAAVASSTPAVERTVALTEIDPDAPAWIFYTSGTTGRPKGAMLSHAVLNFVTVSWLADLTPLDERDVTLHAAPLSHGAGFHALAATARGAHQVITDSASFDPSSVLDVIRSAGVSNTWMVPTQIVMLADAAESRSLTGDDLPSLQYVVYGGAPMTVSSLTRALERFGSIFVQLYGQGETPMTATMLRRHDHVPGLLGSAGRARPGIDVRVVDGDGAALGNGEIGEVVVRGPSVMTGYWKLPEATAETIVDGWLHTGDLGRMTADGVLHLLDRTKDMIISGGSNVYAVEVEQALSAHESIADIAVIGVPDELWGELVVAVVVPSDGDSFDQAVVDAHARAVLAGYKVPRRYLVVESLPRNAYGKVSKRDLRETLTQR